MPSRILIVDDGAMVVGAFSGMTPIRIDRVTRTCVLGESRFQHLIGINRPRANVGHQWVLQEKMAMPTSFNDRPQREETRRCSLAL
jgi:hypothetical protein